jgi:hypothetical protein
MKRILISIATLIAFVLLAAATGWSQPQLDRGRYEEISRQVFVRHATHTQGTFTRPSTPQAERMINNLHDMVTAGVAGRIGRPDLSATALRTAISDLQGDNSLSSFLPDTEIPFVNLADIYGMHTLTIAFAVMSGGDGAPDVRPYIQFYSAIAGQWQLHGEVGSEFNGADFHVAPIKSPVSGQVWYLAWGAVIGDTRARLKLRLYSFDGFDVKTIWTRDDLSGGSVAISGDQVLLDYYEFPPEGVVAPPRHIIDTLRPSLNGLEQ